MAELVIEGNMPSTQVVANSRSNQITLLSQSRALVMVPYKHLKEGGGRELANR